MPLESAERFRFLAGFFGMGLGGVELYRLLGFLGCGCGQFSFALAATHFTRIVRCTAIGKHLDDRGCLDSFGFDNHWFSGRYSWLDDLRRSGLGHRLSFDEYSRLAHRRRFYDRFAGAYFNSWRFDDRLLNRRCEADLGHRLDHDGLGYRGFDAISDRRQERLAGRGLRRWRVNHWFWRTNRGGFKCRRGFECRSGVSQRLCLYRCRGSRGFNHWCLLDRRLERSLWLRSH